MTKIVYHRFLLLDEFRFCEAHFTTYQRSAANTSAISPFLGGERLGLFFKGIEFLANQTCDTHVATQLKAVLWYTSRCRKNSRWNRRSPQACPTITSTHTRSRSLAPSLSLSHARYSWQCEPVRISEIAFSISVLF